MFAARSLAGLLLAFAGSTAYAQSVEVGQTVEVELRPTADMPDATASPCMQVKARKGQDLEIVVLKVFAGVSVFPNSKCAGDPVDAPSTTSAIAIVAPRDRFSVRVERSPSWEVAKGALWIGERPTRLPGGATVTGAIVGHDLWYKDPLLGRRFYDCYAFDAAAGQIAKATLRSEAGSLDLELHKGPLCAGASVEKTTAYKDQEHWIRHAPVEAGAYSVRVSDDWGAGRYALRLELTDASGAPVPVVAGLVTQPAGDAFADAVAAYDRGDFAEAARIFRVRADASDGGAALRLARMYEQGQGVAKDEAEARAWYAKALNTRDVEGEAALALAGLHAAGRGGPVDLTEAARLWARSAARDNPEGAFRLALAYRDGGGVPRDGARAREAFQKAAWAGYARADALLGEMYEDGLGGPRDEAKAADHYRRAAQMGDEVGILELTSLAGKGGAAAQLQLGRVLLVQGGAANEARARAWLRKAAAQRLAAAEFDLAALLTARPDGEADLIEAYVLLARAERDPELRTTAELLRQELVKSLSRDQLARAKAAAG